MATLSVGLRENSRIKMKLTSSKIDFDSVILASILDNLKSLIWMLSEDGAKKRNRPKSILESINETQTKETVQAYLSGHEFENARLKLLERD